MRRWALSVGALAVGILTWFLWPAGEAQKPLGTPTQAERALDQSADRREPSTREAAPEPGTRPVIVDVLGCRGRPARNVLVLAQLGTLQLSARTNDAGQARIAVPEASGEALVRVRLANHETPSVPATGDRVEVSTCPGATVSGRVIDEAGQPLTGVAVRVVDGAQAALDEAEVDLEGHYELADGMLDGAQLAVETPAGLEVRDLAPLAPGESRTVDIVIGRLHEVVGWVLDMNGDPQPGVAVTMRAQNFGSVWATTTDSKGGFRFAYAPQAPVRIDADGGDLGRSSARLAGSAARREVSLTLEPVGEITVLAADADGKNIEGTAIVRCSAETYHGEDPLWTDMIEPPIDPETATDTPLTDAGDEAASDESAHASSIDATMTALESGLRDFDPSTPEDSMKRLVRTMLQEVPELAKELPPGVRESASLDEMVDAMTEQALRENPTLLDEIARSAEYVQNGASLEEALRMASSHAEAAPTDAPDPATTNLDNPADVEVNGDGNDDHASSEPDGGEPPEEMLGDQEGSDEVSDASSPEGDWYPPDTDERTIVARGELATAIPLRGSFLYTVSVRRADGKERTCGTVFLHPGESLTVSCGVLSQARITGRVVDSHGTPVPHLSVVTYVEYDAGSVIAESDAHGRFELTATTDHGQTTTLEVTDPTVRLAVSTRRNIMLLPGETQDVGDIVVRTPDEVPEGLMSKPFGGIGGYISLNDNGVFLDNIEAETPLAYEGAEPGDEIVMIDGVSAGELSMDDVLSRLRGEPGSDVALRIRSKAGELYEIDVTRGIIQPHVASDDEGGEHPEIIEDPAPIY